MRFYIIGLLMVLVPPTLFLIHIIGYNFYMLIKDYRAGFDWTQYGENLLTIFGIVVVFLGAVFMAFGESMMK